MSDPVADKSTWLCMYMSNHPDTLVSYVRHWGKVHASVASAQMKTISSKGMALAYTIKGSDAKHEAWVEFDPPLAGYEEVKPRLLSMKVDAEEALGMSTAPQISEFHLPQNTLITAAMVGFFFYTVYAPPPSSPYYSPMFKAGYTLREALPSWVIPSSSVFMLFMHSLEAFYVYTLCRKHRTSFAVGAQYVAATFALGFPIIQELRRRIHTARIDSIIKGQ
ncbi:hypothetical protein B0H21DRAFT_748619 [Amylocystis lapponica]|nr:hypothetical protein B0H21DRAFT_748619 [Amylocystis lapponica]